MHTRWAQAFQEQATIPHGSNCTNDFLPPPLFPPQIVSVDKGLERCAKMLKMLDEGAIEGGKLGV